MKPKKIILFSPRPQKEGRYPAVPLPLLAISRFLPKEEFEVKIIDSYSHDDYAGGWNSGDTSFNSRITFNQQVQRWQQIKGAVIFFENEYRRP